MQTLQRGPHAALADSPGEFTLSMPYAHSGPLPASRTMLLGRLLLVHPDDDMHVIVDGLRDLPPQFLARLLKGEREGRNGLWHRTGCCGCVHMFSAHVQPVQCINANVTYCIINPRALQTTLPRYNRSRGPCTVPCRFYYLIMTNSNVQSLIPVASCDLCSSIHTLQK